MHGLSDRQFLVFLVQFALLLGVARLLGSMARRLGQPTVIGEVVAGVLLGPTVFGNVLPAAHAFVFPADPRQGGLLELLSWIGMVLLMMRTGIDTDLSRWRSLKRSALLASVCGIVIPFAVGIGVGFLVPADLVGRGGRGLFAVFLATAMSISAVKVIAKILLDLNLLRRDVGFVILGASVIDDTVGWVILAVVVRAAITGRFGLEPVVLTLGATIGFALLALLVVRPLAGRGVRWLEREGRLEHGTTSGVLVLTLACGALTQALGIHAIFGAFVAGLIVGESPRVKEATLESIDAMVMGVFAPVFFAYSGLKVEALSLPPWPVTALVLGGAILGKVVGAGLGARLGGMRAREATAVGVGLSARGSTELVVARIGMDLGVLAAPMYALVVLLPILTSLVSPAILRALLRGLSPGGEEAKRLVRESADERALIRRKGTKVLVPVSGRPPAYQALWLAAAVGRLPGATLVGLSVKTPRRRAKGDGGGAEEDAAERSEAIARRFAVPDFHARVVTADSVDEAVTAEAARGYDLVFLGLDRVRALSHGLVRAVLGAGTSDVVLVRSSGRPRRFRRILLPARGDAPSRGAVELAFLYARETHAHLHLLHVVDPRAVPDGRALAEQRMIGARVMEELVERGRREGVDVRCRQLVSHFAPRAIVEAAEEERADLVLVGAAPRFVERRVYFGTTTEYVLANAPCAVAIYAGGVRREALRAATPEPPEAERARDERDAKSAERGPAPLH